MRINESGFFLFFVLFLQCIFIDAADRVILNHNTLEQIEACKGKLKLKLVRIWGGDEEEDENKFFKTPISVAVHKKLVYICDQYSHCIKVFKNSGEYLHTLGRRGRGPGDLYAPRSISLYRNGDLAVLETGGCRIQRFSPEGKSKKIIKTDIRTMWVGVTSKDEFAVYNPLKTFRSRKLISILDHEGKVLREVGKYHDNSKGYFSSEKLIITIDESDNIYVANMHTPVLRKYAHDGRLLLAITFEIPFEISPVEITLNSRGDEIKIIREESGEEPVTKVKRTKRGVIIKRFKGKDKMKVGAFAAIGTDSKKRIYIVTSRRAQTENDRFSMSGSLDGIKIKRGGKGDCDNLENIDLFRLLVFNSNGRVVAEAQLTTFCEGIYIYGNRIFISEGFLNHRILEYEMIFEQ